MIDSATILKYLRSNKDRFYQEYQLVKLAFLAQWPVTKIQAIAILTLLLNSWKTHPICTVKS